MDFALSEEQAALQDILRDFLASKSSEEAVRAQMPDPTAYDRALWKRMADELGLQSLAIPEEYGGAGYGFVELGIVLEELGRTLTVSPFFASCVLAAQLLLQLDDEATRKELLPGIAAGELVATVALAEDGGSWRVADVTTTAVETETGWALSGHKSFVLDGAVADVILVVALVGDEPAVFAVQGDAAGLVRTPLETMDQTRKQARLELDGTPARLVGPVGATASIEAMLDRAAIAVAADCLGGTARVLDMAVDYAKLRQQFGRPIGSFQAVKHMCASMLVDVESSRSAVYYGLWAASVDHEDVPRVACLAKAFCADAYLHASGQNIQIMGGIGFTWEHPSHLYLKRAKNDQSFLGSSDHHRQLLADRIGI